MTTRTLSIILAVAAILCLLFALLSVFPVLTVGRDALFVGGVLLGLGAAGLVRLP